MKRHISFRPYRREFLRPLKTAHGEWSWREGFIVRIEDDERIGYGEIAPIPDFGTETVHDALAFLEHLGREQAIEVPRALPCCAFGVSSALSDAPLSDRAFDVAALLPAGAKAIEVAQAKLALGYHTLKWKVGVAPFEEERDVFHALLETLPSAIKLRLDANGGLGLGEFERWMNLLFEHADAVEFLEQPLPPGQESRMTCLLEGAGVPIALDESLNGPDAERWLAEWSGPLVIKPLLMGEVNLLRAKLAPVAERVVWSSSFESSFGLQNALGLMHGLPRSPFAIGFGTLGAFCDHLAILEDGPCLELGAASAFNLEALWEQLN